MDMMKPVTLGQSPSSEDIARRAYEIFLRRGCQHGYDVSDWLQAEYELRQVPTSAVPELARPVKATATTATKPTARASKRKSTSELAQAA